MKTWIISDTHFDHEMMVKDGHRPEGYEDLIKQNMEAVLQAGDLLIHLGDVSLGGSEIDSHNNRWFGISFWNNFRILVKGNHDKRSDRWHYNTGWDTVCKSLLIDKYGLRILFSHKPRTDRGYFDINIHGHLHDSDHRTKEPEISSRLTNKHELIALETNGYKPMNLKTIVSQHLEKREIFNKKGYRITI